MKIELKLIPDQVVSLEKIMSQVDSLYKPTTPQGKAIRSISFEVSDKINSKYRKLIKSTDLFNAKKKISISLKYHEAFALFELLHHLIPYMDEKQAMQSTHDYLHQKLI